MLEELDMRKKLLAAFAAFLAIGLIGGGLQQDLSYQTTKGCLCSTNTGEIDCNSAVSKNTLFFTGVFNVVEEKRGTQIIQCSEGERVGSYIEFEEKGTNFKVLSFTIFSF